MRKNILTMMMAALLLASCGRDGVHTVSTNNAEPRFDYHLDWNNAGLDITLNYTHPQADTVTL